ncbi:MAG: hypothetical protein H3C28_05805 [Sphingomonadales bacterium]|nr:hypothetical protein [Sphingomonadales bacterium]
MGLVLGPITFVVFGLAVWLIARTAHQIYPKFSQKRYVGICLGIVLFSEIWPWAAVFLWLKTESMKYPVIKPESVYIPNFDPASYAIVHSRPEINPTLKKMEVQLIDAPSRTAVFPGAPNTIYRVVVERGPRYELYTDDPEYERKKKEAEKFCNGPLDYTPLLGSGMCYRLVPITHPTAACELLKGAGRDRSLLLHIHYESMYLNCGGEIKNMYYEAGIYQVGILTWLMSRWGYVFDVLDTAVGVGWSTNFPKSSYDYVLKGE